MGEFSELAKEKISEVWESKRNRLIIVVFAAFLVLVLFTLSIGPAERSEPRKVFQGEPESVLLPAESLDKIQTIEVEQLVADYQDRFESRMRELDKTEKERDKEYERLLNENLKTKEQLMEMRNMLRVMAETSTQVSATNAERNQRNQRNGQNSELRVPGERNAVQPTVDPSIYRRQQNTQIVSEKPIVFENNVIRTVTQRQVKEMKKTGEVEIRESGVKTISERDMVVNGQTRQQRRDAATKPEPKEEEMVAVLAKGSMLSAITLNGVAAPTGVNATSEPMPVMFRVKKEAMMPNFFTLDVRECHILGSASGRLRDRRVYVRTDSISCITDDGVAIDKPFKAVAVSRGDGLLGVPGEMVFTGDELLENSMYAGFLSGFAQAARPQKVPQLATGGGAEQLWQSQQMNNYALSAVGNGTSSAADRLAEYYMALAEQVSPVLELLPGTEVDFIIVGSTEFEGLEG